ncbi:MAG: outer membrane lipoprotein LolB [Betaproteobacteria bacterium]|nr:outer membrane lipoprotein LolB [Betaproteobacteria bacterium]MDE2150720.1 outer membrane lipoprotein LolB [Betaproteobacteria bacterium]
MTPPAWWRRLPRVAAGAALLVLLGACAAPPRAGLQPAGCALDYAGRISVIEQGARPYNLYGSFELHLLGDSGWLELGSPLGQMLARASWSADSASVSNGRQGRGFDSFEDMTEATLGLRLPRAALQDWVRGRPAPQLPSRVLEPDGFEQLGWQVRVRRENGRPRLLRLSRVQGDESEQLSLVIDRASLPEPACEQPGGAP